MIHKQNAPGMHGARRKKKSDYGIQLEEKQKLKAVFGMITEKQLVNYYRKAVHQKGTTAENLMRFMECRLDVAVYRLGLAGTIFHAHQLVSHGHVHVDGRKVDIRSFQVRPGMTVSIKPESQKQKSVIHAVETCSRTIPSYYSLDKEKFSGQMMSLPSVDDINANLPFEVNIATVCEFLAHTK